MKLIRLREVRERHLLTQQELADKAGVSRVSISMIELGRTQPYGRTIRRIADALEVDPADLMAPEDTTKLAA